MAEPFQTFMTAIRTTTTLKNFVFGGEMAELMVDPSLKAAKEALEKAKLSKDPKLQTWSAITHLESVHHQLVPLYKKGAYNPLLKEQIKRDDLAKLDRWVLLMMATCYKSVDEPHLCRKTIEQAKEVKATEYLEGIPENGPSIFLKIGLMITSVAVDFTMYFIRFRSPDYNFDEISEALLQDL